MMIGVLFDIAVVYYAGGLELFDDEKKDNEEPTKALNRFVLKVNKTKYFPLRQNIDSRIQQQNQRHTDTHTHRVTSWASCRSQKLSLSNDKLFCRIDKLKESSEYNVVYGSHVSLTKDSAFKS